VPQAFNALLSPFQAHERGYGHACIRTRACNTGAAHLCTAFPVGASSVRAGRSLFWQLHLGLCASWQLEWPARPQHQRSSETACQAACCSYGALQRPVCGGRSAIRTRTLLSRLAGRYGLHSGRTRSMKGLSRAEGGGCCCYRRIEDICISILVTSCRRKVC
jgi:hypothetical protein